MIHMFETSLKCLENALEMLGPGFSSSKDLKSTISIEKIGGKNISILGSRGYPDYPPLRGPRGEISKFAPIVPKVIRVRPLMQNLGVPACSFWAVGGVA